MDNYPEANKRHFTFMFQGLEEVFQTLEKRGISAFVGRGHPAEVAIEAGLNAALIVCDMGYLRHQVEWRARVADEADCEVIEVESDVVVPVETASDKPEYMARTLRPKLHRLLDEFLQPVRETKCTAGILPAPPFQGLEFSLAKVTADIKKIPSIGKSNCLQGGTSEAKRRLKMFIEQSLAVYSDHSNQPQTDDISRLSPYLHFGQISPLYIALEVLKSDAPQSAKDAFIEQLIVRRELAMNFVWFTPDYDRLTCLPDWARQTLRNHAGDEREFVYTREELELSQTHDPYWNAAMTEMRVTGFMHNYMRMYWGKKVLEWSASPEEAFETLLAINNQYFIDGRDPNSYAGVAWVFGKHDTAWKERPIFGKVRYMNAAGLKRKCDIEAYVKKVNVAGL
jgi:deoxyribodipyrimidine photo-lyase